MRFHSFQNSMYELLFLHHNSNLEALLEIMLQVWYLKENCKIRVFLFLFFVMFIHTIKWFLIAETNNVIIFSSSILGYRFISIAKFIFLCFFFFPYYFFHFMVHTRKYSFSTVDTSDVSDMKSNKINWCGYVDPSFVDLFFDITNLST